MATTVFEALRTVLAVREYQDREVPDDVVRRILEAGRLTASSMNRQPWHFVLVQDRTALAALAGLLPTGPYVAGAAGAIVVAYEKDSPFGVSDGSRAIQSIALAAWAEGVGTNWVGFAGRLGPVAARLGLPETFDILAVVPFGYPKRNLGLGRKNRKPLSEVASEERFGTPLT